jgi:outer membrane autotransporter protein
MSEFLGIMLDPFVDGRLAGPGGAMNFAPDQPPAFPPDVALAYAGVLKAPPAGRFEQRWTTWGSAFGGGEITQGNAVIGSNDVTAQAAGFAGGMDYHLSPDTVVGFGLSSGETGWSLAQGLGTGRSDAFQVGLYGVTHAGPAYLAAAVAGADHWMSTKRVALGDQLTASFNAQAYGGRIEAGYRYGAWSGVGVTPYAAAQIEAFHTPFYREADASGGGFGLTYNAQNGTDTRSELGFRLDDFTTAWGMPLLLRARVAWAHDWASNPALNATFQALPGASFTVNGAATPPDSALVSAGGELRLSPRWTFLTKFDGEFAPTAQTYAGSGTLRYSW